MTKSQQLKTNNQLAATAYLPLIGPLILLRHYQNPYLARHALTGTLLTTYFCLTFLWQSELRLILLFFLTALTAIAFLQVNRGSDFRLPLITDFLEFLVTKFSPKNPN